MKKKLVYPIVLALVTSLLMSGIAFAQTDQPQRTRHSGRRGVGKISDIGSDQFTVTNWNGASYPVLVNDDTQFRTADESDASFDELRVGQWVIVIAAPISNQTALDQPKFTARLVVPLPKEIDLSQRFGVRTRGVLTGVDLASGTFALRDRNGQILTMSIDETTHFLGQVDRLSDLQPGMNIAAAGQEQSQAYPLAVIVAARYPIANHAGKIVAVDPENGTFNLETVRNGSLTFQVNDQTRFRSPGGRVQSLADLRTSRRVVVGANQEGGGYQAILVVVGLR